MPIIILASCPFQPEIEIKTVNVKCYSSTFLHTIKRKKATRKWLYTLQESRALLYLYRKNTKDYLLG